MQRDIVKLFFMLAALMFIRGLPATNKEQENPCVPRSGMVHIPLQYADNVFECKVIVGRLIIANLPLDLTESDYDLIVFPHLTEVTDFVLVTRLVNLTNLGKLFPKLKHIRGRQLFRNYALAIANMAQLTHIGLSSLVKIEHGGVAIHSCINLCYVDTVDWTKIGASHLVVYDKNQYLECPKECSGGCHGHCWNATTCQRLDLQENCHKQCIGCTRPNSSRHCNICRNYTIEESDSVSNCIEHCPKDTYKFEPSQVCLTEDGCRQMLPNGFIFDGTCVEECPIGYELDNSTSTKFCKYCGDSCIVICIGGYLLDSAASIEMIQACTTIQGAMRIENINSNLLLEALKRNLGRINNITGYLRISRSPAIRNLEFLKRLELISGEILDGGQAIIIYDNPNLESLDDWNNMTIRNGNVSFHNNGLLCASQIERFLLNSTFPHIKNTKESWSDWSDLSNGNNAICSEIDMKFNVKFHKNCSSNLTIEWSDKDFKASWYTLYYISTSEDELLSSRGSNEVCGDKSWMSVDIFNSTSVLLTNLQSYTFYGFYVKAYLDKSPTGVASTVNNFTTLSDDPSEPLDLVAKATSESSILLSWKPPALINGDLETYNITVLYEKDQINFIRKRNYCRHPHTLEGQNALIDTSTELPDFKTNCSCDYLKEDTELFSYRMSKMCSSGSSKEDCKHFKYESDERTRRDEPDRFYRSFSVPSNLTSFLVKDLRHYTLYIIFVQACNRRQLDREQCSPVVMEAARTQKSEKADVIESVEVTVQGNSVAVTWLKPVDQNALIVAYHLEIKRTDTEHSIPIPECIDDLIPSFRISELSPGKYEVRVQAVSLAGEGAFSEPEYFQIASSDTPPWLITLITIMSVVVVSVIMLIAHRWYSKKYHVDNVRLFTDINPDYVEDEWEIERSDVELLNELGKGSFGMVYQGFIKSKGMSCAIKTVADTATLQSRHEFLNEGSVMKTFNDAHHVVRLLGIVSKGQPPLVIMELMERGDLKSYLRRCREPSQNLTTNETYRMAAQIADGMAFLAAKKYVHRDLAARNCMVAADHTVKIGDFGMARDIYETDYYRKQTMGLLPVRWMAPESLADGVFTSDSDVWSYGVVLWEMATLAEQPYQGLSNEEVLNFVRSRGKLERPAECSDFLYDVMDACWMWRPNDRPTFSNIVDRLEDHAGPTFKLVSYCFSEKGQQHARRSGPRPFNPPAMATGQTDDEFYSRYDAAEEEVEFFSGKPSTSKPSFLPLSSQRYGESYQSPMPTSSFGSFE